VLLLVRRSAPREGGLSAVAPREGGKKTKARKVVRLPGLRYDCEPVGVPNSYERTTSVDAARCRPEGSPATQHEHSQQRTTNITLINDRTPGIVKSGSRGPSTAISYQLSANDRRLL